MCLWSLDGCKGLQDQVSLCVGVGVSGVLGGAWRFVTSRDAVGFADLLSLKGFEWF